MSKYSFYTRKNSLRLKNYDYSKKGLYFLSLNVNTRLLLFGYIADGEMILNDAGKMIERWYKELENKFPHIKCHESVVMPDHFHCIIEIVEDKDYRDDQAKPDSHNEPDSHIEADRPNEPDSHKGLSPLGNPNHRTGVPEWTPGRKANNPAQTTGIPRIMEWFKTMTTNEYIRGVKLYDWKRFHKKLWQRSYHDIIIRNEKSYHNIVNYIKQNPEKWKNRKSRKS